MIREILACIIGTVIIILNINIHQKLKNEKLTTAKLFLNKKKCYRVLIALFCGAFSFFIFSILLAFGIEFSERFLLMWIYWLSFLYFGYQLKSIMG